VYRRFEDRGLIFCGERAAIAGGLDQTTHTICVRLHGRSRWYRHDYSDAELEKWTRKITQSGADEVGKRRA
jgi:uncharacterized protein YecE (DUF72 family)